MNCLKFNLVAVAILIINVVTAMKFQSDDAAGVERERDLDRLGAGQHIFRGLDSIGEGSLLRAIYREKPRDFLRINRGLDSLSGASFGIEKRLDSLTGLGFGNQKRNLDEIDRSNFGTFAKRNLDEIDRSDFGRFVKKRETIDGESSQQR
ncbi:orcokinin peptides type B [Daphnia magna]|uniref:Uncharacterized protein n=2 Tax=Daphnia magna TaxID=35525 RepID=A0ABR0AMI7_9CRUS|nr:orcokinin peptides type B [Daphnia magna]KAK4026203.1 hypothetical protein OUZ56_015220 [Daphnia magna]KZS20472.1 Orcokinin peptide-like protein [Daphnia magna]